MNYRICHFCSPLVAPRRTPFVLSKWPRSKSLCLVLLVLLLTSGPSYSELRSKKIDISDIDYIFVCSTFPGLDSTSVLEFYSAQFGNSGKAKISDGVSIEELGSEKKYLLISFGIRPLDRSNSDCLKDFPNIPKEWINSIIDQSGAIGTVPDFLKKQPLGKHYNPVERTTRYFYGDDIFLFSSISIEGGRYFACTSLYSVFQIDYYTPGGKVSCSK